MRRSPEIDQILNFISEKNKFLITSHKDPDGDSIGSQLGLYWALINSGKQAKIINQGGMPAKYFFLDPQKIISFNNTPLEFTPDVVFVLECPSLDRVGFVKDLIPSSAILINIDHHQGNEKYGAINYIDTESCAVGEPLYQILKEGKFKITPQIAAELYAAILCDTGNFRFASTTSSGMRIAADLVDLGANPKQIFDEIFSKASSSTLRLLGQVLSSIDTTANGKISYLQVTHDAVKKAGAKIEDSEGFVDYALVVAGAKLGILFKEVGTNEVKVSLRSQNGLDAAAFARQYDGGGHVNAAGFTLSEPIDRAVKIILEKATRYIDGK
jgi:phosphoesterase RecJ-like protein